MVRACTKSREGRTRAFAQSPPLPFRPCKEPWNPPRIFWLGTSETVDPACTSVERAVVGQEDRSGPKCFSSHLRAVRRKPRFGQTRASRQSDGAAADPAQYDLLQQATRESPMKEHSGVISARSSSRVSCGRKRRGKNSSRISPRSAPSSGILASLVAGGRIGPDLQRRRHFGVTRGFAQSAACASPPASGN